MWSQYSVILVLWSQVSVNHCVCNVVNTYFTWSVYFCVHIYHAPPYGPCTPCADNAHMLAQMHVCCLGERILCASIHHAWGICNKNSDLLAIGNCYAISCHAYSRLSGNDYRKSSTSTSRCTILTPWGMVAVTVSNIGQWNLPREFRTCTSKIYEIFFAVTQETTGAEDRTWNRTHKLILSSIRF